MGWFFNQFWVKLKTMNNSFKNTLSEIFETILIALVIVIPIRYFLIQPFMVKGQSMEPTFQDNNYLIIDKLSYRLRSPQRGEVIVMDSPSNNGQYFIKRIIGLPNETLEIKNGKITIYNQENPEGTTLDEPYLGNIETPGDLSITLKANEYFVLGDNRYHSYDSRSWGVLEEDKIVGKVWVRLWPLNEITVFAAPNY